MEGTVTKSRDAQAKMAAYQFKGSLLSSFQQRQQQRQALNHGIHHVQSFKTHKQAF